MFGELYPVWESSVKNFFIKISLFSVLKTPTLTPSSPYMDLFLVVLQNHVPGCPLPVFSPRWNLYPALGPLPFQNSPQMLPLFIAIMGEQ